MDVIFLSMRPDVGIEIVDIAESVLGSVMICCDVDHNQGSIEPTVCLTLKYFVQMDLP